MLPLLTELLRDRLELKGSLRFQGVGGLLCAELRDSGERVAVRWMPHSPEALEALALLRAFPTHRALPGLLDSGEGPGVVWAVHAFPQGVLLGHQALAPNQLLEVGGQLAGALAALHAGGLVHGELSDESVLLAGARVLLHDAPVVASHRVVERRGEARALAVLSATAAYLSPERAKGGGPSTAADVYALGALLGLASGAQAPPGSGALERMFALTSGAWRLEVPATVDSPLRTLLSAMLAPEPGRRPDAGQVAAALQALERVAAFEASSGAKAGRVAAKSEVASGATSPVGSGGPAATSVVPGAPAATFAAASGAASTVGSDAPAATSAVSSGATSTVGSGGPAATFPFGMSAVGAGTPAAAFAMAPGGMPTVATGAAATSAVASGASGATSTVVSGTSAATPAVMSPVASGARSAAPAVASGALSLGPAPLGAPGEQVGEATGRVGPLRAQPGSDSPSAAQPTDEAAPSPRNFATTLEVPVVPWASAPTYSRPPQTSEAHVAVDLAPLEQRAAGSEAGRGLPYELPLARPTAPTEAEGTPAAAKSAFDELALAPQAPRSADEEAALRAARPTAPAGSAGLPPRPTVPGGGALLLSEARPTAPAGTQASAPRRPPPKPTPPTVAAGRTRTPAAPGAAAVNAPAAASSDPVANLPAPAASSDAAPAPPARATSSEAVVSAKAPTAASSALTAQKSESSGRAASSDVEPAPTARATSSVNAPGPGAASIDSPAQQSESLARAAAGDAAPGALATERATSSAVANVPNSADSPRVAAASSDALQTLPATLRPTAPGPSPAAIAALFARPVPPPPARDAAAAQAGPPMEPEGLAPSIARAEITTLPGADPFEALVASKAVTASGLAPGALPTLVEGAAEETDNAVPVVPQGMDTLPPDAAPPPGFSRSAAAATQQIPKAALSAARRGPVDTVTGLEAPHGVISFFAGDNLRLGLLGAVASLSVILGLTLFAQYEERSAARASPTEAAAKAREAAKRLEEEPPPPGTPIERAKQKLGVDDGF